MNHDRYIRQISLAWLAGVIEADGSIFQHTKGDATIKLSQSSREDEDGTPEMLTRALQVAGLGIIYGPYGPRTADGFNRQAEYEWQARGSDFRDVIDAIWPWLGQRKRVAAAKIY